MCRCALLCLTGCNASPAAAVRCDMGTTWHVTYIDPPRRLRPDALQQGIEAALERLNSSMSTYRAIPRSVASMRCRWRTGCSLSRFLHGAVDGTGVGRQSRGAYDVTVAPLVDLWGFGPLAPMTTPPRRTMTPCWRRWGRINCGWMAKACGHETAPSCRWTFLHWPRAMRWTRWPMAAGAGYRPLPGGGRWRDAVVGLSHQG